MLQLVISHPPNVALDPSRCDLRFMRFNSANAREMAARSVEARKAAKTEQLAASAAPPLQADGMADTSPVRVACVRARLETLDGLMARAGKDSREWDNLTRSYDRMFKILCVLTNTPGPGQRKPPPECPKWGGLNTVSLEQMLPMESLPES